MSLAHYTAALQLIARDALRRRNTLGPVPLQAHLHAAVDWLLRAQKVNGDGGVAASYKLLRARWTPSYPETTGYIIPSLLDYAHRYQRSEVKAAARRMAEFELTRQLPEGGFPCLVEAPGQTGWAVAFDTGQILFGLLATYNTGGGDQYLDAAIRAGDWLVKSQLPVGYWKDYESRGSLETIDARVSWPLLLLSQATGRSEYHFAACRQLDWVLTQQRPDGWYDHCTFNPAEPPVTHTLAYVTEGLLESGVLSGEQRYLAAAKKSADALLAALQPSGFLPGAFGPQWKPAASWSCLTGQVQMARVWLRLAQLVKKEEDRQRYRDAAERAIRFVAQTQYLSGMPDEICGGIAGSWPVFGAYLSNKYPNWAAKFFIDAVMELECYDREKEAIAS